MSQSVYFHLTNAPVEFVPAALSETKARFLIIPPTEAELEMLGYELFRHNISPITTDTFRATMIEELFNVYGEAKGEEYANLIDEYWQSEDIFRKQDERWALQEDARLWDLSNGAPVRPAAPLPKYTLSIRKRSQALNISDDLREKSDTLRDLTVKMQTYNLRQRAALPRLIVAGWSGLSTQFAKENGIIPQDVYAALAKEIGREAVSQLEAHITDLCAVSDVERGNSELPLGTGSDPTSSPEQSGASEASDGTLTKSNTSPAPPLESAPITAASSTSISPLTGQTLPIDPSPMDAH